MGFIFSNILGHLVYQFGIFLRYLKKELAKNSGCIGSVLLLNQKDF